MVFMGSYRQITNGKKNTPFPLDNCFNKRVLFFNEPCFEQRFEGKMLMLFAGDPVSDQVCTCVCMFVCLYVCIYVCMSVSKRCSTLSDT